VWHGVETWTAFFIVPYVTAPIPHHTIPLEKIFWSYYPNLYLSPFLSFPLNFLGNYVNSQLSLTWEVERSRGVSSLCLDWGGSSMDTDEWEDTGIKGGVRGTSWYDTVCINISYDATPFLSLTYALFRCPPVPKPKRTVDNTYSNNKNKCLQWTLLLIWHFPTWWLIPWNFQISWLVPYQVSLKFHFYASKIQFNGWSDVGKGFL
jgi:hypothetical protein